MEKKTYPIGEEFYILYEEVGQGVSAAVHRALCKPLNEIVAIKILDFERENCDLASIYREVQTMILVDHPNVLKSHCSFVNGHNLWIVMAYMSGGSCLHILKAAYPDGFEEVVIATVLREVLKGVEYLHNHGHIHRDIKAGNVLIDSRGAIKLGDFGVSACLFDSGDRQRVRNTFVGTPCWMAPEVMEQLNGYDFKADIWSFAITGLELAHGHAPFSKYPPMKVLMMTLQNAPPGLDYERDKKFSKSFKQMIASCLVKDPSKRPSASKLLKHSFFKQARSNDYIARTLLEGLPVLGDRIKALKRKEEDMLAQKKMPDGKKEELSQNEYKRGISGWNFNLDDLKAQASLIQEFEESISEINEVGSSNSLNALDVQEKKLQGQNSSEISDIEENALLRRQPSMKANDTVNGKKSINESTIIGSCSQHHSSPRHDNQTENGSSEEVNLESSRRIMGNTPNTIQHKRSISSNTCIQQEVGVPLNRRESYETEKNGANGSPATGMTSQAVDDVLSDSHSKDPKSSSSPAIIEEDQDEKAKAPVIQQKGRFKVTSESVDLEKAAASPILQKSHSMQVGNFEVITSNCATPLPSNLPTPLLTPLLTPLPSSDATPINTRSSMFPVLHSVLQTNIVQRDDILTLMRQISTGEFSADGVVDVSAAHITATEKSLLEAAHEREKDLLNEVTELQWRILRARDEIQRLKSNNAG
ncbi:STE20/SPS1-related proline-alanine-rich protein kinase isoform X1 [Cucumis melo var. makuwa]|uniref:STE20/SPS1-related proline-alanine-rich protein kinase isoform X1 n=2 Tax=Cucumis melo TaxID=3656 RepID=A0A5A7T012_CUCMM|nr:STE20/SPS1-related proline-alanine-rich protein kinase isoform X1 [Cucumis melo var. makuwa]